MVSFLCIVVFSCLIFNAVLIQKADSEINKPYQRKNTQNYIVKNKNEIKLPSIYTKDQYGRRVDIWGGTWPSISSLPKNTIFVNIAGYLVNRPAFNDLIAKVGVPDYGDGVVSLEHGTNYDAPYILYSRVNRSIDLSNNPMVGFYQLHDGLNSNAQGNETIDIKTITTPKSHGYADGFVSNFYSEGLNYYGGFDVNKWSHTSAYGTNWLWDNIQELNVFKGYICPPNSTDSNFCFAHYMNEEDLGSEGPEADVTAYDPTASGHIMFWLTTNHNAARDGGFYAWMPYTSYYRYQIILVNNDHGNPYIFYALPTGYVRNGNSTVVSAKSGELPPVWTFNINDVIVDGGITWNCVGPYHSDVGSIFKIGGDNDPKKGWVERIGTLMSEQTDYIYDALFDFSKAAWDPFNSVNVFARIQPSVWIDLSADGTNTNLFLL